jgi:glycerol kinase
MTAFNDRGHVCRAALEAAAYQCKEVVDAMTKDSGVKLTAMKVDGGMTANDLVMQFQADILECPVYRPVVPETTALGAAYAAGLAVGVWKGLDEIKGQWKCEEEWNSKMDSSVREKYLTEWNRAVSKSVGWVDGGDGSGDDKKSRSGWLKLMVVATIAAGAGFVLGSKRR